VQQVWIDTPDGEKLFAWYLRAEKPIASALWCHGNTGNLTSVADLMPHLLDAGYNILLFDYRGFGRSSGRPSLRGVIDDGLTAAKFHDAIRPKHLPSILYGFSLGGGIAAQVLRKHPFDGLILQSTFTTLPELAKVLWPRVPLHLLTGDIFNTMRVIRGLKIPLLVLHGTEDEVVPCAMGARCMRRVLRQSISTPSKADCTKTSSCATASRSCSR
jgi:alpha-beta hydrolase superfamily lysophospholipase